MTIPTFDPSSCPARFRSALMPESDLLRLPHTIRFHCPYRQRPGYDRQRTRDHGSAIADDSGDVPRRDVRQPKISGGPSPKLADPERVDRRGAGRRREPSRKRSRAGGEPSSASIQLSMSVLRETCSHDISSVRTASRRRIIPSTASLPRGAAAEAVPRPAPNGSRQRPYRDRPVGFRPRLRRSAVSSLRCRKSAGGAAVIGSRRSRSAGAEGRAAWGSAGRAAGPPAAVGCPACGRARSARPAPPGGRARRRSSSGCR